MSYVRVAALVALTPDDSDTATCELLVTGFVMSSRDPGITRVDSVGSYGRVANRAILIIEPTNDPFRHLRPLLFWGIVNRNATQVS
jgi:hypothetical protein